MALYCSRHNLFIIKYALEWIKPDKDSGVAVMSGSEWATAAVLISRQFGTIRTKGTLELNQRMPCIDYCAYDDDQQANRSGWLAWH